MHHAHRIESYSSLQKGLRRMRRAVAFPLLYGIDENAMIKTLRTKLLIGIAPLLAIMVVLGLWAIVMFYRLGGNIDVILRENYASVLAAEGMKESLERMDSAVLFAIGGQESRAKEQFREYRPVFQRNLKVEQNNITLPGEKELADELARLYGNYLSLTDRFFALGPGQVDERTKMYFSQLLPTFNRIKDRADDVLNLNQRNMEDMDRKARDAASLSTRLMVLALLGSAVVATLLAMLLSRSILDPIQSVTRAARSVAKGDLDQVVPVLTRDELGELAQAFNSMARTIRDFQQAGTARLLRAQKTAQATIDSFPDPVVVVDPTGAVEPTLRRTGSWGSRRRTTGPSPGRPRRCSGRPWSRCSAAATTSCPPPSSTRSPSATQGRSATSCRACWRSATTPTRCSVPRWCSPT
jgi:NtrC-family two-component system sensor histidine kinase KinB